jgi:hypothetical protein
MITLYVSCLKAPMWDIRTCIFCLSTHTNYVEPVYYILLYGREMEAEVE